MSDLEEHHPGQTFDDTNTPTTPAQPTRGEMTAAPGQPTIPGAGVDEANAPAAALAARAQGITVAPDRGSVRTIHYALSYLVRNVERGPRGAIVLLHDLPGGAFTWADTLPGLDRTGRAVYAFDMLGYGQSDHPWPSDTSIWGHADSLLYAFKALRLDEIVLVGVGLGAAVAQVLATRFFREQTAKLVLLNSYGYEYAFAPNWPLPEMLKRQDPDAPKHTRTEQMLADLRATLPLASAKPTHLAGGKLGAYLDEWNSDMGRELLFQHIRLLLPNYMNAVTAYLRKLEIPVLLGWSAQDMVAPHWIGERMQREIPGAQLQIIDGAGHLVLDDAPDAVATMVADFAGTLATSTESGFVLAR